MSTKKPHNLLASTMLAGVASLGVPLAVGAAVVSIATDAQAQDYTNANLTGSVVDADGNGVAGANVVVRSEAQGFERSTTTNADGEFRVPQIPQGSYTVTVSKAGLQTATSRGLRVQVGAANSYEIAMTAAGESADDEIVVTATRLAEFSQTTTGTSINVAELVEQMPIARNVSALVQLAPTALPADSAFGLASGQSLVPTSVSGASGAENAFFINGLNITNFINGVGGGTVPFDFYQTVEVKTGGYQAEFGRAIGGVVNAVTKSGSNDFTFGVHANWSPNSYLEDRPNSLTRQYSLFENETTDYTLEVGGPIIPDHLFFYGLGQWQEQDFTTANTAGVLVNQHIDDPFYGFKLDGYITDKQHLEVTWFDTSAITHQEQHIFDPATNIVNPTIVASPIVRQGGESYVGRYTGAFTDWLTVSAAYGRMETDQATVTNLLNVPNVIDIRTVASGTLVPGANPSAARTDPFLAEREFYRGDVDLYFNLMGEHHVRFGLDHEDTLMTQQSVRNGSGNYTLRRTNALSNGVGVGIPGPLQEFIRRRQFISGGGFAGTADAIYIQDSYDITDRLNLSLGWRRDQFQVSNPNDEVFMEFNDEQAIRAGFAYDVFGDRSGKLYGSYGRYYLPLPSNTAFRVAAPAIDFDENFLPLGGIGAAIGPADIAAIMAGTGFGTQGINGTSQTACPATVPSFAAAGTVACTLRNTGVAPDVRNTVALDLQSTYEDEFLIGYTQHINDNWTGGVSLTYRNLGRVSEDAGLDHAVMNYCVRNGMIPDVFTPLGACGATDNTGLDTFRIINPGQSTRIHLASALPNGETEITLSEADIGLPQIRREYLGLVFTLERAFDGVWGLDASYTLSRSEGNFEGALKSDIGQVDPGITEDFDFLSFIPGQYGLLPNHRAHQIKVRGSYQLFEDFLVGGNFTVFSPRHYGCVGAAPADYANGDGQSTNDSYGIPASARFCNGLVVDRGSSFDTDWLYRVDLSFRYDLPFVNFGSATLRADIFNLFNMQGVQEASEAGETDSGPDPDYGRPTAYQTPRSIRFGIDWTF